MLCILLYEKKKKKFSNIIYSFSIYVQFKNLLYRRIIICTGRVLGQATISTESVSTHFIRWAERLLVNQLTTVRYVTLRWWFRHAKYITSSRR